MSSSDPLTKDQRRRRRERARREGAQAFEAKVGPIPDLLVEAFSDVAGNLTKPLDDQRTAVERAPSHIVVMGLEPSIDDRRMANIRQISAEERRRDLGIRAGELKAKYPDLWGKRATAKRISLLEERRDGTLISAESIRRMFKRYP